MGISLFRNSFLRRVKRKYAPPLLVSAEQDGEVQAVKEQADHYEYLVVVLFLVERLKSPGDENQCDVTNKIQYHAYFHAPHVTFAPLGRQPARPGRELFERLERDQRAVNEVQLA